MSLRPLRDTEADTGATAPPASSPCDDFAGSWKPERIAVTVRSRRRLPVRFRIGRWFLLAEGVLVAELAGVTIAGHGIHSAQGHAGFMLWGLTLTPIRSTLLFAFGVAAVVSTLNRHATTVVTATAMAIFLVLTAIGDAAAGAGVARQWGVDPHNAGLYAALAVYNFALLVWLIPDMRFSRTAAPPDQQEHPRRGGPMRVIEHVPVRRAGWREVGTAYRPTEQSPRRPGAAQ